MWMPQGMTGPSAAAPKTGADRQHAVPNQRGTAKGRVIAAVGSADGALPQLMEDAGIGHMIGFFWSPGST